MGKKIYAAAFLFLYFSLTQAQVSTKLDLHLWKRLSEAKSYYGNIALLVKGDPVKIKQLTKKYNGVYKYGNGSVSSVSVPEKNVIAFSNDPAVLKIQSTFAKGHYLMDTARIRNNIDSAQHGYAPLSDSMVGKGVVIGIIDGGINWHDADFKNADGSTRILFLWDQSVISPNNPPGFNYGAEWTYTDLNDGSCTEAESYGPNSSCSSDFSHGTCVAGIAAGNGLSGKGDTAVQGKYTGVAPQSSLIVVDVGTDTCTNGVDFLTQISDAVTYIFKTASALGMPCVINTSVGTYYGSRDGIDLTCQIIDSLLIEPTLPGTPANQRFGRVLVAAAGNAGNVPYHLSYTVPSDSSNAAFTFFDYNYYAGEAYFDLWTDTANFDNVWFTIGCNDSVGDDLGNIGYFNVANFSPLIDGNGSILASNLYNGGTLLGVCAMQVTLDSGRYHVEFQVTGNNGQQVTDINDLWRLQTYATNSTSTFDLWASASLIGGSDIISSIGGITIQYPNYKLPDTMKTLVSSWQCSDKVITVGNYTNRAGYLDYDSTYVDLTASPYNYVVGQLQANSSQGPTRDNRLKPDISATGTTIICTGDSNDIFYTIAHGNGVSVAYGDQYIRNGGTSMASPIVAGISALYLQKRPTASYAEVKQVLECTATRDSFTGPNANNHYGYGKVNAFQALISNSCVTFGAFDTACVNYNPLANIDTGGCIAKIYGCTDTTAANYDSLANVNNGTCSYLSGVKNISDAGISLRAMPNPFNSQTTFSFVNNGFSFTLGEIDITNVIGEVMDKLSIGQSTANYIYNNQKLAAGIYFYQLKLDNKEVKSGKLVVE